MSFFNNEQKEQEKELQKQIASNQQLYRNVFDTPEGKAVLEDLKKRCFDKTSTYDDNPYRTYFNEGRRSVYKYIINLLEQDLTQILEDLTKP